MRQEDPAGRKKKEKKKAKTSLPFRSLPSVTDSGWLEPHRGVVRGEGRGGEGFAAGGFSTHSFYDR